MIWGATRKEGEGKRMKKEIAYTEQAGGQEKQKESSNGQNVTIEEVPIEELTRLIRESSDLAIRINATHELVRRAEST